MSTTPLLKLKLYKQNKITQAEKALASASSRQDSAVLEAKTALNERRSLEQMSLVEADKRLEADDSFKAFTFGVMTLCGVLLVASLIAYWIAGYTAVSMWLMVIPLSLGGMWVAWKMLKEVTFNFHRSVLKTPFLVIPVVSLILMTVCIPLLFNLNHVYLHAPFPLLLMYSLLLSGCVVWRAEVKCRSLHDRAAVQVLERRIDPVWESTED